MRKEIVLLILSTALMAVGGCGGPLVMRLYFLYGGKSLWLSAFLQTCGFPIILISLIISYFFRRKIEGANAKLFFIKVPMLASTVFFGFLYGISSLCIAIGQDFLPVSTIVIINSTQLAFTALFAFFIIKHKFTVFSLVSVVLLVVGGAILAVNAGRSMSSTAETETSSQYVLGIVMVFLSSALGGLSSPLIELLFVKSNVEICYTLVMEMQMMISFFANIVAIIGMLLTNAFKTIPNEARNFELGESKYYMVIISTAILFQFVLLGLVGVIFSASALLSGITTAVMVPISEVLAVICLHEHFTVGKGASLGLCLLGLTSYYYGEFRLSKKNSSLTEEDVSHLLLHDTVIPTTSNIIRREHE